MEDAEGAEWKMALDGLNDNAYEDCLQQVEKSQHLVVWRVSKTAFYVKVRSYRDYSDQSKHSDSFFEYYKIPYFERTHVVSIKEHVSGRKYLHCSCRRFKRWNGRPCAEQLKVLLRMPRIEDFWIVNTNAYDYLYGKAGYENVTEKMDVAVTLEAEGPAVEKDFLRCWPIGGEDPEISFDYFERSLPGKARIRDGNYWSPKQPGGETWGAKAAVTTAAGNSTKAAVVGGLQEETHLSQAAALSGIAEEEEEEEEEEDDGGIQAFGAMDVDDADSDDSEARARERWRRGNLYNWFHSNYQNIVKECTTSFAAFRLLEEVLPDLERQCKEASLEELEEKNGGPVDTSMGLKTDRSTSNARLRPGWSPERQRKKAREGRGPDSPE